MMWPFKKKAKIEESMRLPSAIYEDPNETQKIGFEREKSFDWFTYQMQQYEGGLFSDEFHEIVSKDTLKAVAVKEVDIAKAIDAISRQFLGARFLLKSGDKETTQFIENQITKTLSNGIFQESAATFHQMRIFELISTGESFAFITDNGMSLVSLPCERVKRLYSNGVVTGYRFEKSNGNVQEFEKRNIIEWKLPNPFSRYTGLSILVGLLMEILTRKYGQEWTVGFFLRGGSMASQYHTTEGEPQKLARLIVSINQMVGSRRNMHNDKILPRGVQLAAPPQAFSSVNIPELLKANSREIYSRLGVPPVAVGDTDGVNYASAAQQMSFFWKATILPYQKIYCSCIMQNEIVRSFVSGNQEIIFDNTGNEYLDDFRKKLDEDLLLKGILTIDERRKRVGYESIGDERGQKLETELMKSAFSSVINQTIENKSEEPQESQFISIFKRIVSDDPAGKKEIDFLENEVQEWEKIVINSLEDKDAALLAIKGRATFYGRDWAKLIIPDVMAVWDAQLSEMESPQGKAMKGPQEDRIEELRTRSQDFLQKKIAAQAAGSFVGFSETWTQRIYDSIMSMMANNYSLSDIASSLKMAFGEYYEGQFKTVVNTEYRSAMHQGTARFGGDLASTCKKMAKVWMSKIDQATRDTHAALDGVEISGDAKEVPEKSFLPGVTLRYPMDPSAPASETINCRCTMRYKVLKWE